MIAFNVTGPTRHGIMTWHRLDRYVGQSLDFYGEFSPGETAFLCSLVGPGSIVIDGGANIGALTVPLARAVGDLGSVLAIEPQRLTFQALCANVAQNSLGNVRTLQVALGRAPGSLKIPSLDLTVPQNVGGFAVQGHKEGDSVPVVRIDDLNLPGLTLLKLDLEGMEREALAGAHRTIRDHAPIIYAENDREEHSAGLVADLLGMGYRLYKHAPPLYSSSNWRRESQNIFPGIVSLNLLALPNWDKRADATGEYAWQWGLEPVTA